ncbi:MAG TPA: lipopolysaccharide heptosyltransferase I [Pusillimonas sp.]|uniref:lipopolysaccharide heptosyltransferase I n=1 Tax=unclassified Pusillimonas TaxID=2640016 RepID=UPI0026241200|nr:MULTISPECIES: lipopolysaccharide heptosyltransferase I [unclassified Pusillimonas]HLU19953.1 lipopolysaccharide heptosyltransferase I [Pusillimonas sp.]
MTTKILIVRSSSLGDLVHMLPAVSDIARHVPQAQIDWVVEESFAEIPSWHPAIHEVITVAHRRWRKSWWSRQSRKERAILRETLRSRHYDIVLDMQALMKSIWVVRQTRGTRHGLDRKSAREPLASLFYDVKHTVKFWQPAIIRQRELAASVFGYQYEGTPDFGLQAFTDGQAIEPYAVIMPSASRADKLWPSEDWQAVFDRLQERELSLKLLAGNEAEAARGRALIAGRQNAEVLPRMSLTDIAHVLARARIMVGLDSGLTHLSAGLGRPTIGIYKASTPVRTPLQGPAYTASLGERGNAPSAQTVLSAIDQALEYSRAAPSTVQPADDPG